MAYLIPTSKKVDKQFAIGYNGSEWVSLDVGEGDGERGPFWSETLADDIRPVEEDRPSKTRWSAADLKERIWEE